MKGDVPDKMVCSGARSKRAEPIKENERGRKEAREVDRQTAGV